MTPSKRRTLILGTINGYGVDSIDLFVKSARANTGSSQVILFGQAFSNEVVSYCQKADVTLIRAWFRMDRMALLLRGHLAWLHRPLWTALATDRLRAWLVARTTAVMVRRFAVYSSFLKDYMGDSDRVFLSDIRDVILQQDLFSHLQQPGLHAFLEDESVVIGAANDNNIQWIERVFGIDRAVELRGKVSSCAGTIYGDASSISAYLKLFLRLAGRFNAHRNCDDQAIHNYIVHKNLLPNIVFHRNEESSVLTMCNMPRERIKLDERSQVINEAGEPYAVLHHYDRFQKLLEVVQRRYSIVPLQNNSVDNFK